MGRRKKPVEIQYYTFNVSVLPPEANTREYYSNLILKLFKKSLRIKHGNTFYYVLTECSSVNKGEAFYCIISKFLQLDTIEWVEEKNGAISPFSIPDNLEGRKGVYEFVFYPTYHKIAFIKKGKINEQLKTRGAPFRALAHVLKIGFEHVVDDSKDVFVDIVSSQDVIDRILTSKVVKLDLSVHYTNPSTNGDHEEFMDDLYRTSHIGKMKMSITPDSSGQIDTSAKFTNGTIGLTKENGSAKAKIETEEGIEQVDTSEHPQVSVVVAENDSNRILNLISKIIDSFKRQ